ncbi:hypothetical protein LG52_2464 [Geobacillus kaustophilus]|uniref:Uncharacterized protein n=1 Tax=Geobacillus kaustophilus TaxID=1462 RepID=A0A0D8BVK8_GEOKU|nr:hypothetical protein LG52_2464 [Geobacillus kaustophilus]
MTPTVFEVSIVEQHFYFSDRWHKNHAEAKNESGVRNDTSFLFNLFSLILPLTNHLNLCQMIRFRHYIFSITPVLFDQVLLFSAHWLFQ